MKDTISVIVPVYNVAEYLPQCLDSLIAQTYTKLEIILIDDGSTDSSGAICDAYAAKDGRIRVIHQKNGGAANAKNAGLRIATGEYLAFVDSDDWLELDAYAHMLTLLKRENAEVIQCSFRNVYLDGIKDVVTVPIFQIYDVETYLLRFTSDWTSGLMTDKLYCRNLFDEVFFVEGNKIDDEFFTYRGIMNAKKVLRDPKVVYNYRQRASSVTLSDTNRERIVMDKLAYLPERRKRIASKFPKLKSSFDLHYLNMLLYLAKDPYATEESLRREKQMLTDYFREKGATTPSVVMLLLLIKLRLLSVQRLLSNKAVPPTDEHTHRYFR